MAFPIAIPIGMAAAGLLKGKLDSDRAKQIENSDRQLASETARYSPWTRMQPQQIRQAPSAFGTMLGSGMQGAGFGAMLGQGMAGGGGSAATGAEGATASIPETKGSLLGNDYNLASSQYSQPASVTGDMPSIYSNKIGSVGNPNLTYDPSYGAEDTRKLYPTPKIASNNRMPANSPMFGNNNWLGVR